MVVGFVKEEYAGNYTRLVAVADFDNTSSNYVETDSIKEAIAHFGLKVENGEFLMPQANDILQLEVNEAYEVQQILDEYAQNLTDDEIKEKAYLCPVWDIDVNYTLGDRVRYEDKVYKVLQDHVSAVEWTPDIATSLYVCLTIQNPDVVAEWVQPEAADPYMTGDRVMFEGTVYESVIDNNTWSPAEYPAGWIVVTE